MEESLKKYNIFKTIIRESNYDNTYKMAWAKALVELSTQINLNNNENEIVIQFNNFAEKFIKYYWNQTIFFNLRQGSNPLKNPVIVTCVKELISEYFLLNQSNIPELFEKAEFKFEKIGLKNKYKCSIKKVVSVLKQDVCWRFTYLNGKDSEIYSYEKGNDYIKINVCLLKQLKNNEQDLYDLINYRWGLILETFNSSPRINRKVKIMDEREIKRNSLNKFKYYLDLENIEHRCFNCDCYIKNKEISIDHVIPWSYMYSDDIWNLVYVCKSCNSKKNNRIPTSKEIAKLIQRNNILLDCMKEKEIYNNMYDELKVAIENDYVNKFWNGSKM